MKNTYSETLEDIAKTLHRLRSDLPEVMKAFSELSIASTSDKALDKKTKEMIALGISIAKGCQGCIGFHTESLSNLNTSPEEFLEVLGTTIYVSAGAALMYAVQAIKAFDEFQDN